MPFVVTYPKMSRMGLPAVRGLLAIIHWNHDPDTPRGPSMDIRPTPDDCVRWVEAAGFTILAAQVDLPPYHYGIIAQNE